MENINSVIDNLCIKLGTTVEVLIPELIKYKRTEAIADLIIYLAVLLLTGLFCKQYLLKLIPKEEEEAEVSVVKLLVVILVILILLITPISFFVALHNLVVWTVSPEGASVEYLLRLLQ